MMVKLGQIASTRNDVLPAPLTAELVQAARGRAAGPAPDDVRVAIEHGARRAGRAGVRARSSGSRSPPRRSARRTARCCATATRVVVKVRRPGIEDVVARDASVLRMISGRLERRVEAARSIGLRGLTEELIAGLQEELEFLHEAKVGTALAQEPRRRRRDLGAARVHDALDRRDPRDGGGRGQVGRRGRGAGRVAGPPPPARRAGCSRPTSGQILDDGLFHADPHPGNMLIDARGHDLAAGLRVGRPPGRPRARTACAASRSAWPRTSPGCSPAPRATWRATTARSTSGRWRRDMGVALGQLGLPRRHGPAAHPRRALRHAPARDAPAVLGHAAGALAADDRGHAAPHRPRLQPHRDEPRGRPQRPQRCDRHAAGDPPARGAAGAAVAAHAARARRDARQPAAVGAPERADRAASPARAATPSTTGSTASSSR